MVFLFILAISTGLRLYKLGTYSFWYDEACWMLLDSPKDSIGITKPPLFKFLLNIWANLGQNEFILRLLPFIFGVLSIPIIYKIGKILFDKKVGILAAFFLSISPFHIYYSQELTNYTLTLFLCLCSIYYFIIVLKENKFLLWIGYIAFTTLSIYSHYPSFFLLATENLIFLIFCRKYKTLINRWLLSQLIIILLYLPWLVIMPEQFRAISIYKYLSDWIPCGSILHIFQALRLFTVGYNANFIINFIAEIIFFPLLLIGFFSNLKNNRDNIWFLTFWLFIPMILSILFASLRPTFTYRNFIYALPAYYIIISLGMVKLKKHLALSIFFLIILYIFPLINYYRNVFPYPENFYRPGVHAKNDNRSATRYIISNFKEQDVVLHTSSSTVLPYIYYLFIDINKRTDGLRVRDFLDSWPGGDIWRKQKAPFNFPKQHSFLIRDKDEIERFTDGYKRVWLVFSHWEPYAISSEILKDYNAIKKRLDADLILMAHKEFDGINIYLYQK